MPQVFVRQSTALFSIVILVLLMICIGLLVAVLKGQLYHDSTFASPANSDRIHVTTTAASGTRPEGERVEDIATFVVTGSETATDVQPLQIWEKYRLPSHVIPLHYNILLHPNIQDEYFTGNVNITLNITMPVSYVLLHSHKLNISETKVHDVLTGKEVAIKRDFMYIPNEFYVLELEDTIPAGLYDIYMDFTGSLVGSIVGFYKSRYRNSATGEERFLATSKFQPTYARRAFPCFDEPTFKSTFTVSLVHTSEYIALSNMPAEGTHPYLDGNLITTFQRSVPMVTYLICFIVCDFSYESTLTRSKKMFRVFASEDNINRTQHALTFGKGVLEFYEDYFDLEYVLPKQDMVAIPDYVSGATEHWGIITFRYTNLLFDPLKSSPQNKQRVSIVISHEMAHMWFGNLVTMEWWDDLWLNEGFASYIEYKGVNQQYPEWDMLDQFLTNDMQPVMDLDATMSSHPIVQPVNHPDEITEIFDSISYNKGASVLRMLEYFLGEENFRKGISRFLKKYRFGSAKTEDLWTELSSPGDQRETSLNISDIMTTWTQQMGYPCITVIRDSENASVFTAKQKRFLKNDELYVQNQKSSEKFIWRVPLSYITSAGHKGLVWLPDDSEETFSIPASKEEWVKFNVNQTGYYIVNYDKKEWEKLIQLLQTNRQALNPADRSNLLFDLSLLAEAGYVKYSTLLSMAMYLKEEIHLTPWQTAYDVLQRLSKLLELTDAGQPIKKYIAELSEPLYKKLAWKESENHLNNILRSTVTRLACHSGNKDCLNLTSSLLQKWVQGEELPSSFRRLVYRYGMAEIGQDKEWKYMWNRYLSEDSPQERKRLLYGLAHVRNRTLINKYLEYAMDETKIRRHDFYPVLQNLADNPSARILVWNFLRENWLKIVDRFTLNDRGLGVTVKAICSHFTTDNELKEMQLFFKKFPNAGAGTRRRKQALENVQNNIKWLNRYKDEIKEWLLSDAKEPWLHYRLPSYVVPVLYNLTLRPIMEEDQFTGSVVIDVKLHKDSNYILLHSAGLNIETAIITDKRNLSKIPYAEQFYYEENNYFVTQFSDKLPIGDYTLYFEFSGNISQGGPGLFKASYIDPTTEESRFIAATDMQSFHARKVFPCFDEPSFKAQFSIRIVHGPQHTALSNIMETATTVIENSLMETTFERSVPMSTYTVCVVVGEFKFKEAYTKSGIRLRVYSTPHNLDRMAYALEVGKNVLTFFETYFDQQYPLKKLDMIAIPGMTGAMENWGLITYEERILLVDDNENSAKDVILAASVISHELAHMWFGNLVTMRWWNDLWLNEGFASYMSYKGVQAFRPSWNYEDQFVADRLFTALKSDALISSHPIVHLTRSTAEITDMFDSISYSKGASILRMLETIMGDDFRKGVNIYLKKYAYGNVDTSDLWTELTLASTQNIDVRSLMTSWTMQMNYPYITVKVKNSQIFVQQHHFLSVPENRAFQTSSPYGHVWQVPLTYYTSEDKTMRYVILNSTKAMTLTAPHFEWIKFNVNFTGYYLVNYDVEEWTKFTGLLETNHKMLTQTDRANLLYDSFALASAGHLPYDIPLNLSSYLKREVHPVPWYIAYKIFNEIEFQLDNETVKEALKQYVRNLSKDIYRTLSWNDTGHYQEKRLRNVVIEVACENKNHECLTEATKLLKKSMKGEKISRNLRHLVYKYGMQTVKDEETWHWMWQKYLGESSSTEKTKLLEGLANVKNQTLLGELMEVAWDQNKVDRGHYFDLMKKIKLNPLGSSLVTEFLYRNWTQLVDRFTLNNRGLGQFVKDVYGTFNTDDDLKQVQYIFRRYSKVGAGKKFRAETLENIRNNMKWLEKHRTTIEEWLMKNVYMPWKASRLPRHVIPTSYDIRIHPNVSTAYFEGITNVTINVTEPSNYLLIHSDELNIIKNELRSAETGEVLEISETFPFELNHYWVIIVQQEILPGIYDLFFEYSGNCVHESAGMIKSYYTHNITQEKRYLLYTQFQPTYARTLFPCFDEPSLKATFRVTVVHDQEYTAVSNMPEESHMELQDGLIETAFLESPPMSTYLVCIIISDFSYIETEITYGKKMRYYAPPDRINSTLHTVNVTPEILRRFEEFYGIPYALPKLDFAAVPMYPLGGMENWGLVVLGERNLIDNSSTLFNIMHSDKIVSHELAHQWFGNLVTMRWWDDIWLNEGFSSFAMYQALRYLHPESKELVARRKGNVMWRDSSPDSRPIVKPVRGRSEIGSMFDRISYEKGASVLSMLENIMKNDFRTGLSNYLKKYAYSNAETKDLWNELSKASKEDLNISAVMDTWTRQMGFPYIEIQRNEGSFTARQNRFVEDMDTSSEELAASSPYGYVWKVPLTYKNIETGEEYSHWLDEEEATFPLDASPDVCLKFNPDFIGFYIVNYDDIGWRNLCKKLQADHEVFSVTDRYNILFDAAMLVKEDLLSYDTVLELTKYLKNERRWNPWLTTYSQIFPFIDQRLRPNTEISTLWMKYKSNLIEGLYDDYKTNITLLSDFEDADAISYVACSSKLIKCLEEQYHKLVIWLGNSSIPTDDTSLIALRYFGNDSIWETLWERLTDVNATSSDQMIMGHGLSQFQNQELIKKSLEAFASEENLSAFIFYKFLNNLRKNPAGLPILWDYVKQNWEMISLRLSGVDISSFKNLISNILSKFKTKEELEDAKKILTLHKDVMFPEEEKDCYEQIEKNIDWLNRHEKTIGNWLQRNVQD